MDKVLIKKQYGFLYGFLSLFDLSTFFSPPNNIYDNTLANRLSIQDDWIEVGHDISNAMIQLQEEYEQK